MSTQKFKQKHNSPLWNVTILGFIIIISSAMLYYGNYGMLAVSRSQVALVPSILGVATLLLYFLSRLVTKRFNWIITFIGICSMLFIAVPIFFGVARYQ